MFKMAYLLECGQNEPIPEPLDDSTSKYVKIATNLDYSSIFRAVGECNGSYMWFTTEERSGTEYLISHSEFNIISNGAIAVDIPENADYIYFQFTNFNVSTNVLQGLKITEISGGSGSINEYSSILTLLPNTTPTLTTGLYVLTGGQSGIYIGSASPNNLVFGTGEIFYYDSTDTIFYGEFNNVSLVEGTWGIAQSERIENVLTNNRNKIPTSQAVYNAISGLSGSYYTSINEAITFNLDGTMTPSLSASGFYYFKNHVWFYEGNDLNSASSLEGAICYYDATNKVLTATGTQKDGMKYFNNSLTYVDSTDGWNYEYEEFSAVLTDSSIATSISSSSTNSQVASALAVYNAISSSSSSITMISNDIILQENVTPTLTTGLYVLTNAEIFIGSSSPSNVVFGKGEIIYYDSSATTFYGNFNIVALSEGTWGIRQNDIIENSLTNSRNRIPTSQAVYNAMLAQDVTSQFTFTPESTFTLNNFSVTKIGLKMASVQVDFTKSGGTISADTLIGTIDCLPLLNIMRLR